MKADCCETGGRLFLRRIDAATAIRRQFTGRQFTAATDNRVPSNRATLHQAGSRHHHHHFIISSLICSMTKVQSIDYK